MPDCDFHFLLRASTVLSHGLVLHSAWRRLSHGLAQVFTDSHIRIKIRQLQVPEKHSHLLLIITL